MSTPTTALSPAELQRAARDHLWLHFTRMGGLQGADVPDHRPRRRLLPRGLEREALPRRARGRSSPCRSATRTATRSARRRPRRCASCPSTPTGRYAHPRAIELAAEIASLAPGDLNRVFFVSGGSEAVESAWKLARQYATARGERRWKAIARRVAYHGTTMGALSINGVAGLRTPFEPLVPEVDHVRNTNRYHRPEGETEEEFTAFLLDELEETIDQAGPDTVAIVDPGAGAERGRRVHAAGRLLPGRAGALRPVRHPAPAPTRSSPASAGSAHWFGSERYDIRPDLDHVRQGALVRVRVDRRGHGDRRGRWSRSSSGQCSRTGSRSAGTRCSGRSRSRTSRS